MHARDRGGNALFFGFRRSHGRDPGPTRTLGNLRWRAKHVFALIGFVRIFSQSLRWRYSCAKGRGPGGGSKDGRRDLARRHALRPEQAAREHPFARGSGLTRGQGARRTPAARPDWSPPLHAPDSFAGRRALRSAGGEPRCAADSARLFTLAVHLPVRPWSPRSQGFLGESDAGHMAAPRRPVATSGVGPRRRRSTRSCRRTSRAGSSGEKPPSGPCRDTSRTSSAAISSAGSSASASPARSA
jgi:hypothetical protein